MSRHFKNKPTPRCHLNLSYNINEVHITAFFYKRPYYSFETHSCSLLTTNTTPSHAIWYISPFEIFYLSKNSHAIKNYLNPHDDRHMSSPTRNRPQTRYDRKMDMRKMMGTIFLIWTTENTRFNEDSNMNTKTQDSTRIPTWTPCLDNYSFIGNRFCNNLQTRPPTLEGTMHDHKFKYIRSYS